MAKACRLKPSLFYIDDFSEFGTARSTGDKSLKTAKVGFPQLYCSACHPVNCINAVKTSELIQLTL